MDDIEQKVIKIVAEQVATAPDKITMASSIANELGADSLDVVEIVMSLEDEFGIVIPDDAMKQTMSVGDVVDFVRTAKAKVV